VATVTTVGYGDYSGADSSAQMLFTMVIELCGLAIFSMIVGSLSTLEKEKGANSLINEKKIEVVGFIRRLD
jgi:uncharacterized membrane protein YeiB